MRRDFCRPAAGGTAEVVTNRTQRETGGGGVGERSRKPRKSVSPRAGLSAVGLLLRRCFFLVVTRPDMRNAVALVEPAAQVDDAAPLAAKWRRGQCLQIDRLRADGAAWHEESPPGKLRESDASDRQWRPTRRRSCHCHRLTCRHLPPCRHLLCRRYRQPRPSCTTRYGSRFCRSRFP